MALVRTAIGLILILTLLVAVGVVLWRRRAGDEIHSIDSYRHALDTLQDMRGPAGTTTVRVLGEEEQSRLRQPHPQAEIRSGVSSRPPLPRPEPPSVGPPPKAHDGMVFRDGAPSATEAAPVSIEPPGRGHGDPSWAMTRAQRPPHVQNRQFIVGGIAVIGILVLVLVGVVIGQSGPGSHKPSRTSLPPSGHRVHPKPKPAPTTTTTVPKALDPQGATSTSATYLVPSGDYEVTVTATQGPCWTIATDGSGKQVFAGSVVQGAPQRIPGNGTVHIEIDAPANVSVSVGGAEVTFPQGYSSPLVLSFEPAPEATTTTTVPGTPSTTVPVTTTSIGPVNS
jgi:hypothetical protein